MDVQICIRYYKLISLIACTCISPNQKGAKRVINKFGFLGCWKHLLFTYFVYTCTFVYHISRICFENSVDKTLVVTFHYSLSYFTFIYTKTFINLFIRNSLDFVVYIICRSCVRLLFYIFISLVCVKVSKMKGFSKCFAFLRFRSGQAN